MCIRDRLIDRLDGWQRIHSDDIAVAYTRSTGDAAPIKLLWH